MRDGACAVEHPNKRAGLTNAENLRRPFLAPILITEDVLSVAFVPSFITNSTSKSAAIWNVLDECAAIFYTIDAALNLI